MKTSLLPAPGPAPTTGTAFGGQTGRRQHSAARRSLCRGLGGLGAGDKLLSSLAIRPSGFEEEILEDPLVLTASHSCGGPNWLPPLGQ